MQPSSKSRSTRERAARVHHRHSPQIDAVTRVPKRKRPNAQKHGAFSVCPTIPGEEPREFQKLLSTLIDEWQASGPTEADAVFSLADLMWRKHRLQKFVRRSLDGTTFPPRHPAFDEARGLFLFLDCMYREPETAFELQAKEYLRADKINYLREKFPRSNYQSTSQWADAVIQEIKTIMLPVVPRRGMLEPDPEFRVASYIIHASELLEDELNLRERLDERIHRQVKHLIQLKAWKQMLRQTTGSPENEQPKRIAARSGLQ